MLMIANNLRIPRKLFCAPRRSSYIGVHPYFSQHVAGLGLDPLSPGPSSPFRSAGINRGDKHDRLARKLA